MVPLRWSGAVLVVLVCCGGVCGWAQNELGLAGTAPTKAAAPPYPTGVGTPLGGQIAAILAGPRVSRAHWGIAVTAMDGTPLYGLEEGKLFRPASTAKLFTTAAAMAVLGPQKTWKTEVRGDFDAASGTVTGDLTLVGAGDPDFGTNDLPYLSPAQRESGAGANSASRTTVADLEELADKLVAKGVKRIQGDVVGDDTLFPYDPYPAGWAEEDAVWGYGAPVSALSVADNQLRMTVTPLREVKVGEPDNAPVALEQFGLTYYKIADTPETVKTGERGRGIDVARPAGAHTLQVYGSLAADAPPDTEEIAIDDPAAFAAMALQKTLMARGIEVLGSARGEHDTVNRTLDYVSALRKPGGVERAVLLGQPVALDCLVSLKPGKVLAAHESRPVIDDIVYTVKVSENLHAELLLHDLGVAEPCGGGSTLRGARMVRAVGLLAGISPDDFLFYDGSGLSTKDIVTPRAETQLLAYAARQPWFAQWKAALPVGGVDGTLSSRFKDAPLKGHVFAKTGTLGESRALAGYAECAGGRMVIFSVMVDNHLPGGSADREAMDRIVSAIAETQ